MSTTPTTFVIAEAGVNHNGSLETALALVDEAAHARADAVKFQTFKADALVSAHASKAEYQRQTTDSTEGQRAMIRRLELTEAQHRTLMDHCRERAIEFLSSPFDLDSIDLLARRLELPRLKLPSGELTNAPFLLSAARTGRPLIVSTGMATLGDIEAALGVLAFGMTGADTERPGTPAFQRAWCSSEGRRALEGRVTLLHCTTEYPAPLPDVNLRAMDVLRAAFGLPVGYSDHTQGITIPIAAVARGAVVIEKHFTLDRTMPGPDHRASLEPTELADMVSMIRQVEEALGHAVKAPAPSEMKNMVAARKSLVASRAIRAGEPLTTENLATKRPGSGIAAMRYFDYLGKNATRDYAPDDLIVD